MLVRWRSLRVAATGPEFLSLGLRSACSWSCFAGCCAVDQFSLVLWVHCFESTSWLRCSGLSLLVSPVRCWSWLGSDPDASASRLSSLSPSALWSVWFGSPSFVGSCAHRSPPSVCLAFACLRFWLPVGRQFLPVSWILRSAFGEDLFRLTGSAPAERP